MHLWWFSFFLQYNNLRLPRVTTYNVKHKTLTNDFWFWEYNYIKQSIYYPVKRLHTEYVVKCCWSPHSSTLRQYFWSWWWWRNRTWFGVVRFCCERRNKRCRWCRAKYIFKLALKLLGWINTQAFKSFLARNLQLIVHLPFLTFLSGSEFPGSRQVVWTELSPEIQKSCTITTNFRTNAPYIIPEVSNNHNSMLL